MNKQDFYDRHIIEGPLDDPYSYSANMLPKDLLEEYEAAKKQYRVYFDKIENIFKTSSDPELLNLFFRFEEAYNHFQTLACAAMFLYGAELMEKECAQKLGEGVLINGKEN